MRLPYAGKGAKKAGQAGLGGLGWRKGVVRLLRLEKRFKLEERHNVTFKNILS